jgi:hypothetical protein
VTESQSRFVQGLIVLLGVFALAVVLAFHNITDGDLWAKLAIGSSLWNTGHLLRHDVFAFTPTLPNTSITNGARAWSFTRCSNGSALLRSSCCEWCWPWDCWRWVLTGRRGGLRCEHSFAAGRSGCGLHFDGIHSRRALARVHVLPVRGDTFLPGGMRRGGRWPGRASCRR